MKKTKSRILFQILNGAFMTMMILITVYPILYVLCASFSNSDELLRHGGKAIFFPMGFTTVAYKKAFEYPTLLSGYANTAFVVVSGVILSMFLSSLGAYFMSRKDLMFKRIINKFILFTMFFSGGLIPFYLTVRDLKLIDSIWSLVIPSAISTYNMIILSTGFSAIPDALEESARIDGAGHFRILFVIMFPLAQATIAVVALYYGVSYWNAWFNASIFLKDSTKWPLQMVLRQILILNDSGSMTSDVVQGDVEKISESIKYAVIILATVPILIVYPFLQKYFTKGVMIGAVKG